MKVERTCACGRKYIGGKTSIRCPECKRLYRNARQKNYERRRREGILNYLPGYNPGKKIKSTLIRYSDKGGFDRWKEDRGY